MKEYINQIFKFLLLIVQKKRKRNLYKSNTTKTDFEAATSEIKSQRISSEPNPNLQEESKPIEKNNISDSVIEKLPTDVEENKSDEIQNELIHQTKYDNDIQIETIVNEHESKYDTVDREAETNVFAEDDIKEANKTIIKEKSVNEITERRKSTSSNNDSSAKNRVHETKPQFISKDADIEDKQQTAATLKNRKTTSIELKKDMDELLQKINRIFIEHKLLGNFDFTEDEYSELLDNVGLLCNSLLYYGNVFQDKHHKLIFTTLVEIAKRWKDSDNDDDAEENSRFWDYISKHLINEDYINQKLYHAFTDVISQLGRRHLLPIVLTGKKYYSTLMMHSFSPKNSIFSYVNNFY